MSCIIICRPLTGVSLQMGGWWCQLSQHWTGPWKSKVQVDLKLKFHLEEWWTRSMAAYGFTRAQWVNSLVLGEAIWSHESWSTLLIQHQIEKKRPRLQATFLALFILILCHNMQFQELFLPRKCHVKIHVNQVDKNFHSSLLIGWQHSCQPIRSQVRKFLLHSCQPITSHFRRSLSANMDFHVDYSQ